MHRPITKSITYVLICAFLCQNTAWAGGGYTALRPEYGRIIERLGERLGSNPEEEWRRFNGGKQRKHIQRSPGITDKPIRITLQDTSGGVRVRVLGVENDNICRILEDAFWGITEEMSFDTIIGALEEARAVYENRINNFSGYILKLAGKIREIDKILARKKKSMSFPAGMDPQKAEAFYNKYGDFGEVEGIIGSDRRFIYNLSPETESKIKDRQEFDALIERLNTVLGKLDLLPPDTTVRVSASRGHPVVYHKEDNILEIHPLLLTPETSEGLLEFVARHDERHSVIKGLAPWWEEILNIYMDILRLEETGNETADRLVNSLRELEGTNGYWRLLVRRKEAFGTKDERESFLKDIIRHIWNYHPTLHPPQESLNGIHTTEHIYELLEMELQRAYGELMTLWRMGTAGSAGTNKQKKASSPAVFMRNLAQILLGDIHLTEKAVSIRGKMLQKIKTGEPVYSESFGEEKLYAELILRSLWMNGRINAVASKGDKRFYVSDSYIQKHRGGLTEGYSEERRKVVYVPDGLKKTQRAKRLIAGAVSGPLWDSIISRYRDAGEEEIRQKLLETPEKNKPELEVRYRKRVRKDMRLLEYTYGMAGRLLPLESVKYNLKSALEILRYNPGVFALCAALLNGADLENFRRGPFSKNEFNKLKHTCFQARKIAGIPFLPREGASRSIQNYVNLFVQLSTGKDGEPDCNIILLVLSSKLQKLAEFVDNPDKYEMLSEREKDYIEKAYHMLYIPMAEFLGLEDIAGRMRDLWLMMTDCETYRDIKDKIVGVFGIENAEYEDLYYILKSMAEEVEESLSSLGIRGIKVRFRVKSVYSVWEKIRSKPNEYPNPEALNDILGISIIFPKTEIYEENYATIRFLISSLFSSQDSQWEYKSREQYGYEEYDFISSSSSMCPRTEVQIYPSENDYRIQRAGRKAHWIYKLQRLFREQKFDTDILERTQNEITGDFSTDFYTMYNALSQWIFAGIIVESRKKRKGKRAIHIVRLPMDGACPADLVCARGVNRLTAGFSGLKDITSLRIDKKGILVLPKAQKKVKEMRPGIFASVSGRNNEARIFSSVKERSQRVRTYLLVSEILNPEIKIKGSTEGKDILSKGFLQWYRQLTPRMENTILDPIAKGIGLTGVREFYKLVYLISRKGEAVWRGRIYTQVLYYLTGVRDENIQYNNIEEAVHLVTAVSRGKEILHQHGVYYTNPHVKERLELLLPEYGLDSLHQLYARVGMFPEFIYNVLLRYSVTGRPEIRLRPRSAGNIYNRIAQIMDREDTAWEVEEAKEGEISISFSLPRIFARTAISRILKGLRNIPGIDSGSIVYLSSRPHNFIKKVLAITVNKKAGRNLVPVLSALMAEFDLGFEVVRGKGKSWEFVLTIPSNMSVDILKEAVEARLKNKNIKYTNLEIRESPVPPAHNAFMIPLFGTAHIMNTAGISSLPGWMLYIAGGILLAYTLFRILLPALKYRAAGALVKKVIQEDPKVLLLDIDLLDNMDEAFKKIFIQAVNQVKGRVIPVSLSQTKKSNAILKVYNFFMDNSGIISRKAHRNLFLILNSVQIIKEGETKEDFAAEVYSGLRNTYKAGPENVIVFTGRTEFEKLWRRIAGESLFYILDKDILYVSSDTLQRLGFTQKEFKVPPGTNLKLLPEYIYRKGALEEMGDRIEQMSA